MDGSHSRTTPPVKGGVAIICPGIQQAIYDVHTMTKLPDDAFLMMDPHLYLFLGGQY
jgi:hypothetical protein